MLCECETPPLGSRRDMPPSGHTTGREFFCLDGVLHPVPNLSSLRVIETLQQLTRRAIWDTLRSVIGTMVHYMQKPIHIHLLHLGSLLVIIVRSS